MELFRYTFSQEIFNFIISFEITYLLIFASVLFFDLFVRWLAFGRFESIALDIAIFSCLYCYHQYLTYSGVLWGSRTVCSTICVLILIAYHHLLREALKNQVNDLFIELANNIKDIKMSNLLRVEQVMAKWSVDVSLWKRKTGKRRRRKEIREVLTRSELDVGNILNDNSLFLPSTTRRVAIFFFILLGFISFLIPVITISN